MDSNGYPFQGTLNVRKTRYMGSLISHCKGINLPIVCYTHKKNEQELIDLKNNNNLSNLEIKLLELTDMKFHKEINEVREKHFDTGLDGRGPEIMWGKFQVMEQELDGFDRVYWVDIGLQHAGIFPWRFCVPYGDKKFHNGQTPIWVNNEISQYDFTKLFNTNIFTKLNELTKDKVFIILSTNRQTDYKFFDKEIISYGIIPPYPIGGVIGGDTIELKKFISKFWEICKLVTEKDFLCTEESIMKVVYDSFNDENLLPYEFSVHQTNEHDPFHFEEWDKSTQQKPLYVVWQEILNS